MPYTPLNPETRGKLLSALNDVARVVFPRLLSPLDAVAEAVYSGGEFRLQLDDLPSDVIAGILERGGDQKVVLGKHILDHNRNAAAFRLPLNEILWPVLMDTCHNLDTASLRVLWDTMIESGIQQRSIADVMLNLAEEFCETPWSFRKQPAQIAEISILLNVWVWPSPIPPSVAHAVAEAMTLALDTRTLPANEVLKWALRLGRIGLARRAILTGDDEATPPNNLDQRIRRFCCLSGTMEGLIHFVGDHLYAYVDNLEEYEQRYFSPEELVPKLSELRQLAGGAPGMPESGRRQESEDHGLSRLRSSVEKYLVYRENIYAAIPHLIAAFFYVDRDTFLSHQTQRLVEKAERWLCYWTCNGHRYGIRQSSFNPDQFAAQELRLKVVQVWHEGIGAKQLLANVRRMLDQPPCRRWTEVLAEGSSRTEYEYILPCWLLELRALRMHGRDTPEWAEADRLTATRLSHLVGAYSIPDNWSRDPGFSLFLLELLRQVAVSRSRPNEAGASDAEILKSARHVLVRLEMIDCPGVRRTLCGFLHPILTAIAAWRTRTHADPAEGLCLFQMARSRWMIDQLALENRTLVVRAQDDELSRTLKDKLFQELNQEGMPASASHWQAPSAALVRNLRRDAPDLCRLVLSNWLNPDVMKSLPNEVAVLAFEMEHDPADPPRLCIAKSSESWSAFAPGIDSQLWTFVAGRGHVAAGVAGRSCGDVFAEVRRLTSLFGSGLIKHDAPAYHWTPQDVDSYEKQLTKLAELLLHPVEDSITDPGTSSLLIVPSGNLFEIPWAALPLKCVPSSRLIDAVAVGVLPNLGLAVWQSEHPATTVERNAYRGILVQAAPTPPTGLQISDSVLAGFRELDVDFCEAHAATPDRALQSLQRCEFVAILCHGRLDAGVYLELSPVGDECGRLTVERLESMPAADGVLGVLLGACWTGLRVQHGAEGAEGLAGLFLLKGVKAVFAGTGCVPIPVDLITRLTQEIVSPDQVTSLPENMATAFQQVQKRFRDELSSHDGSIAHPWRWASIALHGVPWL